MAGKGCAGAQLNNAGNATLSRAYCEGIDHRMATNGATIGDNPHAVGSEAANAWDLGWSAIHTDAGGATTLLQNCCAVDTTKVIIP